MSFILGKSMQAPAAPTAKGGLFCDLVAAAPAM